MRIVVWNCSTAFHRKFAQLAALGPDVAIIPECESPRSLGKALGMFAPALVWTGDGEKKGLAVLGLGQYRVRVHESHDPNLKYFLPVEVEGPVPFRLLATWAFNRRLPGGLKGDPGAASGLTSKALDHYHEFLAGGPSVMAGDFNHNVLWDKPKGLSNHSSTVTRLKDLGMISAYHAWHGVDQGAEAHPTLYWRDRKVDGPGYHIDYCFIPESWRSRLRTVETADPAAWLRYSDHVPLSVNLVAD